MCGVREWQYDMENGTVLSVFGLAGGRCGIEGKHCVVVLMQYCMGHLTPEFKS